MNTWTPAATVNKQPASAGTLGGKGTLPAQHTTFNTLDNWGHKTPTQSKRKRTGNKGLKGHDPEHVYNTLGYTSKWCKCHGYILPSIDNVLITCMQHALQAILYVIHLCKCSVLSSRQCIFTICNRYMNDLPGLFKACFGSRPCPGKSVLLERG